MPGEESRQFSPVLLLNDDTPEVAAARIVSSGVNMPSDEAHQMRLIMRQSCLNLNTI